MHELRGWVDAVAVGMGTVRADNPRLDARDVDAPKQPRRLAFGRGPCRMARRSSCGQGAIEDELRALAQEGVQTLLARRRPDARVVVPRSGSRRQAHGLRRAEARGRGRGSRRGAAGTGHAAAPPRASRSARTCCWRRSSTTRRRDFAAQSRDDAVPENRHTIGTDTYAFGGTIPIPQLAPLWEGGGWGWERDASSQSDSPAKD